MKKILTILLITACVFIMNSQTDAEYEIGLLAGVNFSKLKNENFSTSTNANQLVGYNIGIQGEYFIGTNLGIKSRILLIQKGDKRTDFDGSISSFTRFNLDYITIPIMLSWHYSEKGWFLDFGPYIGFLLSAEDESDDIDVKNLFNNNDFGFSIGFGRGIDLGENLKVFAEIRSQIGVTDIIVSDSTNLSNLSLGFNIGLVRSF